MRDPFPTSPWPIRTLQHAKDIWNSPLRVLLAEHAERSRDGICTILCRMPMKQVKDIKTNRPTTPTACPWQLLWLHCNRLHWPITSRQMLRFWTIYTPPIRRLIQTARLSFILIPSPGISVISVPLHHDLCTICSDLSLSVWYNLLQVRLSSVDVYRPLLSFTYNSIYDEKYINCTTRMLRP